MTDPDPWVLAALVAAAGVVTACWRIGWKVVVMAALGWLVVRFENECEEGNKP